MLPQQRRPGARRSALVLCLFLAVCRKNADRSEPHIGTITVLLEAASDPRKLLPEFGTRSDDLKPTHPIWPVWRFLEAESYRARGERDRARLIYRTVVQWACSDSVKDGWGGSGVAAVALWRWVQLLNEPGAPQGEIKEALAAWQQLLGTRLVRGMFDEAVLSAFQTLPQIQEDLVSRLAVLARKNGLEAEAERLALDHLALVRTSGVDPSLDQLMSEIIRKGLATVERVSLLRGSRLVQLRKFSDSLPLLEEASKGQDLQVRAEASLQLGRVRKVLARRSPGVVEALTRAVDIATNPETVQQALLERATTLRDDQDDSRGAMMDVQVLRREFPAGAYAADATWFMGRLQFEQGRLKEAAETFQELRDLRSPNDYRSRALLHRALCLYATGDRSARETARGVLRPLVEADPPDELRRHGQFWLGRIAEQLGEKQESERLFGQLLKENPCDFYAIRARMHLNLGPQSTSQWHPDERTLTQLAAGFLSSVPDTSLRDGIVYLDRLKAAIDAGLLKAARRVEDRLREHYPGRRLEDLAVEELDRKGIVAPATVWLSLRLDALAAADRSPEPSDRLKISAAVRIHGNDPVLAMLLLEPSSASAEARMTTDSGYLATAYPIVFPAALVRSARKHSVRTELLYAVMRHESLFSPAAISPKGALGLFQFMPGTFKDLDRKWGLLNAAGRDTPDSYLLDPELNIDLAARWFRQLLISEKGDEFMALLEHNVGAPQVSRWKAIMQRLGCASDVEYFLETAGTAATRNFARHVLTAQSLAAAGRFFEGPQAMAR